MRYSGTLIIQDISKRKYTRHSEQKKKTEISVVVICVLMNLAPARCPAFTPLEEPLHAGDTQRAQPGTLPSQCWTRLVYMTASGLWETHRGDPVLQESSNFCIEEANPFLPDQYQSSVNELSS